MQNKMLLFATLANLVLITLFNKETIVDEVNPSANELFVSVPFAKAFRIIIKGVDTSGKEIARVSLVILSTKGG